MVQVNIGDPHNDQVAAAVMSDLFNMIRIAEGLRDDAHDQGITDEAALLAATTLSLQESKMTRDSMAALLAAALMHMIRKQEDWEEILEGFNAVTEIMTQRANQKGFGWRSKESVREEYWELLHMLATMLKADQVVVLEP